MHFDRSFWLVTAVLTVLSVISIVLWASPSLTPFIPEAVDKAEQIDRLLRFLAAAGSALFIFVVGYIIYFTVAFRRRATDAPDAIGIQVHDNHKLELWWTVIPAIFVVIMGVFSVQIWAGITLGNASNGLVVESIGRQWYYTFRYPEIHGEISNEMHVPLGQPVTLHVTSQDVIHSFWVPDMRIKADMVPGLINTLRFTPTHVGRYQIVCTEFCGTQHGEMNKQWFVVDTPENYQAWYKSWQQKNAKASDEIPTVSSGAINLAGGDAAAGKALFAQKCSTCHAAGPFEQKIVGPGLKDVLADPKHPKLVDGDDATPENVAKILQNGYKGDMGMMPNQAQNAISDKDIANLVAFLKTLK